MKIKFKPFKIETKKLEALSSSFSVEELMLKEIQKRIEILYTPFDCLKYIEELPILPYENKEEQKRFFEMCLRIRIRI